MTTTKPHHRLAAWQEAMGLVRAVYGVTRNFPMEETYGLTSRLRRSAISIPSNVAEGAGRGGRKEFLRFLNIARGSLSELETQLLIAADLKYLPMDHGTFALLERVSRLITGLHKMLAAQRQAGLVRGRNC